MNSGGDRARQRLRSRHCAAAIVSLGVLLVLAAAELHAQVRLPEVTPPVPNVTVPGLPGVGREADRLRRVLDPVDLLGQRQATVRDLLTRHSNAIEADPRGAPAVRSEVLAMSPSAAALAAARAAGFDVVREFTLESLNERVVVLRAPAGTTTEAAIAQLRQLDPAGAYDYNHLLVRGGVMSPAAAGRSGRDAATAERASAARRKPVTTGALPSGSTRVGPTRVGLIDGGIDLRHPALRRAAVRKLDCEGGGAVASEHGTAVASLLVGRARRFTGSSPEATLYAADIYCGQPTGGALVQLLQALDWLARERVAVINVSLVGPPNATLARVVRGLTSRGHLLVAAVGNDGPASPPLYPAAYATEVAGVVAVTAVDARNRVLPEAARGEYVVFAAPGADMLAAASGSDAYAPARGTSFAAPLVAGLLANAVARFSESADADPRQAARRALDDLVRRAVDLGPAGRDATFGFGLVAQDLRVDPMSQR